jgi:hypothetical protein
MNNYQITVHKWLNEFLQFKGRVPGNTYPLANNLNVSNSTVIARHFPSAPSSFKLILISRSRKRYKYLAVHHILGSVFDDFDVVNP